MKKELIRNGGFERGNFDFWVLGAGTITIENVTTMRGNYSAKMVEPAIGVTSLTTKDYTEVFEGEIYRLTGWLKSVDLTAMVIIILTYDEELNTVSGAAIELKTLSGFFDWSLIHEHFVIPEDVSYIRVTIEAQGTDTEYGYIDSFSLQRIDVEKLAVSEELLIEVENETSLGTQYGEEFFTGMWKEAEYDFYCTSLTGTAPDLDVTIQGLDPNTEQWKDVLVFQKLEAAGGEFKTVLSGLGWKQRVKYVTSGTAVTDCDFKVGVTYKR